jgi:hypothetical protein
MINVIYPSEKPTIRSIGGNEEIFCLVRKRWMLLTPEEWVRQNFLLYLIDALHYPVALIAVEKQLHINQLKKRFDIVVYKNTMEPSIIVECKEMAVKLSENTLQQVLQYYTVLQSGFIIITNGNFTFGFKRVGDELVPIDEIPVCVLGNQN